MPRRTRQDWLAILKDQEASDLNIADYGRHNNISVTSLYSKRSEFKQQGLAVDSTSNFMQVTTAQIQTSQYSVNCLLLEVGAAKLYLPTDIDANWLGQLIKAIHP